MKKKFTKCEECPFYREDIHFCFHSSLPELGLHYFQASIVDKQGNSGCYRDCSINSEDVSLRALLKYIKEKSGVDYIMESRLEKMIEGELRYRDSIRSGRGGS